MESLHVRHFCTETAYAHPRVILYMAFNHQAAGDFRGLDVPGFVGRVRVTEPESGLIPTLTIIAPGHHHLRPRQQAEGEQVDVPVQLIAEAPVQVVAEHDSDPRRQPARSARGGGQSECVSPGQW